MTTVCAGGSVMPERIRLTRDSVILGGDGFPEVTWGQIIDKARADAKRIQELEAQLAELREALRIFFDAQENESMDEILEADRRLRNFVTPPDTKEEA